MTRISALLLLLLCTLNLYSPIPFGQSKSKPLRLERVQRAQEPARIANTGGNGRTPPSTNSVGQWVRVPAGSSSLLPNVISARHPVDQDWSYICGTYEILQHLGIGAFGQVVSAKQRRDGTPVVIKKVLKSSVWHHQVAMSPLAEIEILQECHHPNIIKLKNFHEDCSSLYIVMEQVPSSTDLFDFIDRNCPLSERVIMQIFSHVALAIDYLHGKGIVHGDIKDENILVDWQGGKIKLIDFGSAFRISDQRRSRIFMGTAKYAAPELIANNGRLLGYQGPATDMFAMGLLLETMTQGYMSTFSSEFFDLLNGLMNPDPLERLTSRDVLAHSWFQTNPQ